MLPKFEISLSWARVSTQSKILCACPASTPPGRERTEGRICFIQTDSWDMHFYSFILLAVCIGAKPSVSKWLIQMQQNTQIIDVTGLSSFLVNFALSFETQLHLSLEKACPGRICNSALA